MSSPLCLGLSHYLQPQARMSGLPHSRPALYPCLGCIRLYASAARRHRPLQISGESGLGRFVGSVASSNRATEFDDRPSDACTTPILTASGIGNSISRCSSPTESALSYNGPYPIETWCVSSTPTRKSHFRARPALGTCARRLPCAHPMMLWGNASCSSTMCSPLEQPSMSVPEYCSLPAP